MIKLVNLLKEIKVLQPIVFKTNTDLFNYLKTKPDLKKKLANEYFVKVLEMEAPQDWNNSTLEQVNHGGIYGRNYDEDGIEIQTAPDKDDPVLIISEYENILYVSIKSLKKDGFPDDGTIIKLDSNTLYIDHA